MLLPSQLDPHMVLLGLCPAQGPSRGWHDESAYLLVFVHLWPGIGVFWYLSHQVKRTKRSSCFSNGNPQTAALIELDEQFYLRHTGPSLGSLIRNFCVNHCGKSYQLAHFHVMWSQSTAITLVR